MLTKHDKLSFAYDLLTIRLDCLYNIKHKEALQGTIVYFDSVHFELDRVVHNFKQNLF